MSSWFFVFSFPEVRCKRKRRERTGHDKSRRITQPDSAIDSRTILFETADRHQVMEGPLHGAMTFFRALGRHHCLNGATDSDHPGQFHSASSCERLKVLRPGPREVRRIGRLASNRAKYPDGHLRLPSKLPKSSLQNGATQRDDAAQLGGIDERAEPDRKKRRRQLAQPRNDAMLLEQRTLGDLRAGLPPLDRRRHRSKRDEFNPAAGYADRSDPAFEQRVHVERSRFTSPSDRSARSGSRGFNRSARSGSRGFNRSARSASRGFNRSARSASRGFNRSARSASRALASPGHRGSTRSAAHNSADSRK
jgi:hypothetical protein